MRPTTPEETADAPSLADDAEGVYPDPALLITVAAMQLDTRSLVRALLAVFDGHAWQGMGLVASARSGEPEADLPAAQLAIDCLAFLLNKAEADLDEGERREVQRRLNDLRVNYLARLEGT